MFFPDEAVRVAVLAVHIRTNTALTGALPTTSTAASK